MQESISFGQWLKRRRKALDLTQAALARAVPCAVQTIRALEADELRSSQELAARLAQVLGLPTSDHSTFVAFARGRLDAVPPEMPTVTRTLDSSTPVSTAPIAHPSGTVTFLFTDIEGSTQLWEHTPQAMHTALARHDDIMHESVSAAGGYVYKTIGDAFQAAFATADQAVAAALAAQWALHTEAWGTPSPLRVRMALHTGVTEERAGDYAGPLLNRVARLMAAGHGGQILISAATHELVWDQLPPGVTLRDLGVHLLKDLIRPEPIFQVVAPDLPSDFPALKTRGSDRSNLPAQATPFIGREQEVESVCLYMRDSAVRLLTLTGPGGTGKTRLALQSAAALHDTFPDGVWFVDLAPIQDATLVIAAIAQTLNIREARSEVVTERLTSYLRDKQLLLLLDNFEQVLAASVLLGNLLGAAPQVKMLVTSRARLHLSAEHELPVPPLAVPDLQHLPSPDRLMQVDAVQLFVTRARAVQPGFQLTDTNAQAVAAICIHLDGLPLAIELAAARSKLLAPGALLTRLGHRLHVLTGGIRDLALRHQTLRSTIDWSYALLDTATQALFRRLGTFVGGWTVEAADAVCSGGPEDAEHGAFDTLEKLAVLLDNSLVQQHPTGTDEEPRFTMLETLREYALEQVAANGEIEAVRRQHAIYYLGVAEVGAPQLQSMQWRMWQTRLEAELENFRAALQWSLESGEAELGLRLGAALVGHWWVPAFLPEWYRQVQETAVTTTSRLPPATRANILRHVGRFAFLQADYPRAMMLLEQGVVFCRETGDQSNLAATLMFLADVVRDMSDYARASMLYQESLDIYRQLDDTSSLAWLYHSWSDMAMQQGEDAQGLALSQEGLRLFRALDAKPGMGLALHLQGIFRQRQGDDTRALACLAECLVLYKEVGSVMGTAIGLGGLAVVMITLGQRQPADSVQRIATTRRAIQLLGAAEALREASTCPLFQVQRKEFDRAIPVARAVLDEATFMHAWTDGRAMSLEQAMAYALDEVG